MLYRDIAYLITTEIQKISGVQKLVSTGKQMVFVNKKDIGTQEFYLASQSGIKLELMLNMHTLDYNSQEYLEFNSKTYKIIRTYDKGEQIELKCQAYGGKF
ncbi:phage head-tail adapter protein [Priestia megaterium]|uniref:phage head closure protein n=1 Tax=Priestia megaterium TaxID=1404 RepID=UPI000BEB8001|nr:phage head closure protein [Priestia megaterium]MED3972253.1 phage head closure protein [Priestia megaterium]PEB63311.1 phage head-tail adapter protein [Priestia megaterium]